jgi:asparagine synthase (glutamine-hydrolysing)
MCGLACILRFDGPGSGIARAGTRPEARADAGVIAALSSALAHRGPDGEGHYRAEDGAALLVHRRLAIIDPHSRADQPMATPDGRFWLVYNGEAYNYRELASDLRARGVRFRTESDTEVLLHLLVEDGPAALARVRGMFAVAMWDARERSLLVARDRFGIKPLYLSVSDDQAACASEIGALRAAGLAGNRVSPGGVLAFLAWGSVPQPLTWLDDVEALAPGTWRSWRADGVKRCGRFADATAPYVTTDVRLSVDDLRRQTGATVADSVRSHLIADVPVGVFLSGGIDSGAIVSAARSVGAGELHSYTVTVDDRDYDEASAAAQTAAAFGTVHHHLRVDASHIVHDLDAILTRLDSPTADAVNSYYVSRAVAETGVKAVLSGVGGDEMFGGYPSFTRIPAGLSLQRALGPMLGATAPLAGAALPAWRAAKWRHFAGAPRLKTAYRALRGFFMPEELTSLAGPALRESTAWAAALSSLAEAEQQMFTAAGPETPHAAVARMETRMFLQSQLLRDIDAVSMAHALEVRTPFVDHILQETLWPALGAHPDLMRGKRLLHETLNTPLPREIASAPKRGFTLPFAVWLKGPLRHVTRDGVDHLVRQGWVDADAAARVWAEWERGQAHWSRVWGLGMLGRFLGRHA